VKKNFVKTIGLLLALILFGNISIVSSANVPEVLLQCIDFEDQILGSNSAGNFVAGGGANADGRSVTDADNFTPLGNKSMQITMSVGQRQRIVNLLTDSNVGVGGLYKFSAKVKLASGHSTDTQNAVLQFFSDSVSTTSVKATSASFELKKDAWTEMNYTFIMTDGSNINMTADKLESVAVALSDWTGIDQLIYYIDDICIYEVHPANTIVDKANSKYTLINSMNFNDLTEGGVSTTYFINKGGASSTDRAVTATYNYSETGASGKSVVITHYTGRQMLNSLRGTATYESGEKYRATAMVRVSPSSVIPYAAVRMRIYNDSAAGSPIVENEIIPQYINGKMWAKISTEFTASSTTLPNSMTIVPITADTYYPLTLSSSNPIKFIVDEIRVEKIESDTATFSFTNGEGTPINYLTANDTITSMATITQKELTTTNVIFAKYVGGKLDDIYIGDVDTLEAEVTHDFTVTDYENTTISIFWWDMDALRPICASEFIGAE